MCARANNSCGVYLYISVFRGKLWGKLAYKWVCLRNFVTELAYAPSTNSNERVTQSSLTKIVDKKDVLKNRFISNYFMSFASSLLVKFSKIVFPV